MGFIDKTYFLSFLIFNIPSNNSNNTIPTLHTSLDKSYPFFYNWEVVADNCSGAATPVTVTVTPGPALTVNSPSICAGQTATLSAGYTGSTYIWNTGATTQTITTDQSMLDYYFKVAPQLNEPLLTKPLRAVL